MPNHVVLVMVIRVPVAKEARNKTEEIFIFNRRGD